MLGNENHVLRTPFWQRFKGNEGLPSLMSSERHHLRIFISSLFLIVVSFLLLFFESSRVLCSFSVETLYSSTFRSESLLLNWLLVIAMLFILIFFHPFCLTMRVLNTEEKWMTKEDDDEKGRKQLRSTKKMPKSKTQHPKDHGRQDWLEKKPWEGSSVQEEDKSATKGWRQDMREQNWSLIVWESRVE